MKKKVFTLLTLLVLCVTGAWAQDETIFSYSIPSTAANPSETGWDDNAATGTIGGTCSFYYKSGKGSYTDGNDGKVYKMDGADASVKVTLTGSNKFQVGDKVIVNFSGNSGSDARNFVVKNAYKGSDASNISSPSHKNSYTEETVTLSAAFSTLSVLYIERNGGMSIASVRVVRPGVDPASPTCTTSQTSESVQAGMNLNLSVTATHYTSTQWYKATLSNLSDAAAIPSATNTTYTYTPEDADAGNTYYFYCVATNDNATGAKTAQSGTITVNVTVAQLASQTYTNNNTTCTWGDFNVQVAGNTTKSGNGLYFNAASGSKIQMNSGNLQVVSDNLMYVEVPSASSSGTVTILNGTTTGRYFQTESGNKVYIKADTGQPNTIDFTSADVVTVADVPYLKLTSKSDNKFNGVKIVLNGGFVKTNAGKWASFTPASTAVYNGGAAMTSFTLPAEAKAYIVTDIDETNVTASVVDVMGAGNGYFIKGEGAKATYPVALTTDAASATTGNLLVAVTSATIINASSPDANTKFVLGTTAGEQSGLFKVTSDVTVAAGKAYLNAKKTVAANSLSIDFDDVTGIQTIKAQKELLEGDFYNLKGQKVAQPTKGLYIVNGRKVV